VSQNQEVLVDPAEPIKSTG